MKAPQNLKSILREYDPQSLKFSDDIVIERILQFWDMKDYELLRKKVDKKLIIDYFKNHISHFDKKTANFRTKLFNLPDLSPKTDIYERTKKPTFRRSIR